MFFCLAWNTQFFQLEMIGSRFNLRKVSGRFGWVPMSS